MTKRTNEPQAVELAAPVVEPVPAAPVAEVAQEDDGEPSGAAFESVTPPRFEVPEQERGRRYWVGVREDAPFEHFSAAGISFLKFRGPSPVDDDGSFNRQKIQACGVMLDLTPSQVAKLHEKLKTKTFRRRIARSDSVAPDGKQRQPVVAEFRDTQRFIFDTAAHRGTAATFVPGADDEWVGHFLYAIPVTAREVVQAQRAKPDSWFKSTAGLPAIFSERWVVPRGTAQAAA